MDEGLRNILKKVVYFHPKTVRKNRELSLDSIEKSTELEGFDFLKKRELFVDLY